MDEDSKQESENTGSTHEAVEDKDVEELSAIMSAAQGVCARSIPRRRFITVITCISKSLGFK